MTSNYFFENIASNTLTCHSCKQKCVDIWFLLEHVFVVHGFRLSDENLPTFNYSTPKKIIDNVELADVVFKNFFLYIILKF